AAIKTALPAASVVGFVLGKAEGVYQNVHLNAEYFLGPERDPGHAVAAFTPAGISRKASIHKLQGTVSSSKAPATKTRVATVRRKGNLKLYLGGLVFAFVVVGALVPLRSGRTNWQADLASLELPDLSSSAKTAEPAEPVSRQAVPSERKNMRPATITVPSVGLRANHSLSSQTLARTTVQAGEKVEILRKYSATSGPDWIQVRTKTGKVGWVIASAVKETGRR
ncbi:MAG: SH3 domain-containing protein, partial [Bacteroidetes bacterium]|nr:SH3 domain-containing protein [Bacteroidota bacterium]